MRLDSDSYSIALEILSPDFIDTPQVGQRNALIKRTLKEVSGELEHLHSISSRLIAGSDRPLINEQWDKSEAEYTTSDLIIQGQQVMQVWERPLMAALALAAASSGGDILEVGFGMGISAGFIQREKVTSHTIIEANDEVGSRFAEWVHSYPESDIRMILGRWQDRLGELGEFDGIIFDTYPADESEYTKYIVDDVTFAAHFFPHAAKHLCPGGVFTYYTSEIDSLSRGHQRALLRNFSSFSVNVVRDLQPPADCNYWWADSMAVVVAKK